MSQENAYIVFGIGGFLGHTFFSHLSERVPDYRLLGFDHIRIDITQPNQVSDILKYYKPTVVVNCAAISDLDICEKAPTGTLEVNSIAPGILAKECRDIKAKFVHISSCMVFDGKKKGPYSEKDCPNPLNELGKTKVLGEEEIEKNCEDYLILRPGWLFGNTGKNFVTDWISLAENTKPIAVRPVIGSPTYVDDFVEYSIRLIEIDAKGLFHVSNSGRATMKDFAEKTLEYAGVEGRVVLASKKLDDLFGAKFPPNSVLSTKKCTSTTKLPIRQWQNGLKQCLFNINLFDPGKKKCL